MAKVYSHKDLVERLEKGSQNLSLCYLDNSKYNKNESTVLLMHIISYLRDNADEDIFTFSMSSLYQKNTDKQTILGFSNEDDKNSFLDWYYDFRVDFDNWSYDSKSKLWPDKSILLEKINQGEPLKIEHSIKYPLKDFDSYGKINEKVFDLFHWTNTKCQDTVYRYNGMFAFSSGNDASLFKLTWVQNTNKFDDELEDDMFT